MPKLSFKSIRYLFFAVILILIVVLLLKNIMHNEFYDYKKTETSYKNMLVRARLTGKYKEVGSTTFLTSPYKLRILYETDDLEYSKIELLEISLIDRNTNATVFSKKSVEVQTFKQDEFLGTHIVHFVYKNLDIPYLDYDIHLNFKLYRNDGTVIPGKLIINTEKDYRKFASIRFWDRMMGV